MRQLYPVLWVATLGLAAVILLRPGGVGTLLALAANWENAPWADTYTPQMQRAVTVPQGPSGPSGPGTSSRPAAWPGASRAANTSRAEDTIVDADGRPVNPQTNPLRDSPPLPPQNRGTVNRTPADEPQRWREPRQNAPTDRTNVPAPGAFGPRPPIGDRRLDPDQDMAPVEPANVGRPPIDPPPPDSPPADLPPIDPRAVQPESASAEPEPQGEAEIVDPALESAPPATDQPRQAVAPPAANAIPCEGAEMLGRVGSEVILAKELSTGIADLRAKNPDAPQEALDAEIRKVLKQRLDQKVEEKLIYLDAKRSIPADNFPKVRDNVIREFENQQVPHLMKATRARTRQEMENALEAAGTSLEMQKRNFVEQVIAHEWLRQQAKFDETVSPDQRRTYYNEHAAEFEKPCRARWEQLTVKVSRFSGREEAHAAIAQMGNRVLDGEPLAEVAKAQSHGVTAREGGRWDWTTAGSLASPLLNRAIFGEDGRPGIPVGALSPILEEEHALHIIRVVAREPAGRVPFPEAQVGIKKTILAEREAKAKGDYLAKLRRETPVWTAFDTPATASTSSGWLR